MLRAIEEQDLPVFKDWRNQLTKYFRQYRQLTNYDQMKWWEEICTNPDKHFFAIWNGGSMVGCCGLDVDRQNRSGEISLYIGDPKVAGQPVYIDDKVAPLALRDLMAYGFGTLGLHRIWVEVFDYDDKKTRLIKNEGFELEGTLRDSYFKGAWAHSMIYGLLETKWRSASVPLN